MLGYADYGQRLNGVNENGDMMFHIGMRNVSNDIDSIRSKRIKANGEETIFGQYRAYDLPTSSGHMRNSVYLGRFGQYDSVRSPSGVETDIGSQGSVLDSGESIGYYDNAGNGLRRYGPNGNLLWESEQYLYVTKPVTGKYNRRAAFTGAPIGSPSGTSKAYMTMFGGQTVDLTSRIPSNIFVSEFIGMTDSGMMLASGRISGRSTYFVLDPVPEPASMLAIGIGVVGLIRRRKRVA